jgi:hypothetical protein
MFKIWLYVRSAAPPAPPATTAIVNNEKNKSRCPYLLVGSSIITILLLESIALTM